MRIRSWASVPGACRLVVAFGRILDSSRPRWPLGPTPRGTENNPLRWSLTCGVPSMGGLPKALHHKICVSGIITLMPWAAAQRPLRRTTGLATTLVARVVRLGMYTRVVGHRRSVAFALWSDWSGQSLKWRNTCAPVEALSATHGPSQLANHLPNQCMHGNGASWTCVRHSLRVCSMQAQAMLAITSHQAPRRKECRLTSGPGVRRIMRFCGVLA